MAKVSLNKAKKYNYMIFPGLDKSGIILYKESIKNYIINSLLEGYQIRDIETLCETRWDKTSEYTSCKYLIGIFLRKYAHCTGNEISNILKRKSDAWVFNVIYLHKDRIIDKYEYKINYKAYDKAIKEYIKTLQVQI